MVEDENVQHSVLKTGKVDTIISEPIGVMLFHERMVESFLLARDLFLKPGGQLLPSGGSLWFCPFTDEGLYTETDQKVNLLAEGGTLGLDTDLRRNSSILPCLARISPLYIRLHARRCSVCHTLTWSGSV